MGVGGRLHQRTIVLTSKYAMLYHYVMCQKGSLVHRACVQLDPASADILHDHLEENYDMCQVCPVAKADIDPDLLIK